MSTDQENIEHLKKKHLIHKFKNVYEPAHEQLILRFYHWIEHLVNPHHYHAIVHTEGVKSPDFESLSESQKVNRSTYALWKIHKLNPEFFNVMEKEVLEPRQPRILRQTLWHGSSIGMGCYLGWNIYNRSLTPKVLGYLGAAWVARHVFMFGLEWATEQYRMIPRKRLAREYMELIGAENLHKIVDPNYSISAIKHMANPKLPVAHHGHGHKAHHH